MRWTRILTAGVVASLGFVSACGAPTLERADPGVAKDPIVEAKTALMPDAQGPAPEVAGAKTGGLLTVPYERKPQDFDPSNQYFTDTISILGITHRTLTAYAYRDGKSVLVPDLATDLGKVSEDGLTWSFTLKDGIKYETGDEVKAADVVFALKRSFDADLAQNAPTYQRAFFKGGAEYKGPYSGDKNWKGVEARGDKTIVIHLEKRFESLPYFAAYPQFSPIPEAADKKHDYTLHPLATGPYKFKTYTPGSELILERNLNWDPKSDPARNAYLDGYHFKFGVEDIKAQSAILSSNGVDATSLNWDPIDSTLVSDIEGHKKAQFVEGPGTCTYTVNMVTSKIPLPVRKAIAVAYPFDSVRKAGAVSTHSYAPNTEFMMPQITGHLDYDGFDGFKGTGDGDREKAKKLLADAGYSPGREFELVWYYANDRPVAQRVNEVRKQKMIEAGFKVKDIGLPEKEVRKARNDANAPINMLQGSDAWCFDWPAADSVFPPMMSSVALAGGSATWGNLEEAKVDAEIASIQERPLGEQGPEWGKFDKWVFENYLPAIPYQNDKANVVFGTKVKNVVIDAGSGRPAMTQIWISE